MRAWRAAVVTVSIAAPLVGLTVMVMVGCDLGSPASPVGPPVEEASVVICPTLDPSFESIRAKLLNTNTCGSARSNNCHSSTGVAYGTGGNLDFSADASALYSELVITPDGGMTGHKATNSQADAGDGVLLVRVAPGDGKSSFLYIKLNLHTLNDPAYGAGMPRDYPGNMCPEDIATVKAWIDNGAKFEELDAGADASEIGDANSDAADAGDDAD